MLSFLNSPDGVELLRHESGNRDATKGRRCASTLRLALTHVPPELAQRDMRTMGARNRGNVTLNEARRRVNN